jgi:hypothetical protein
LNAELHSQPASGLVGAVLELTQLSLDNRHIALVEVRDGAERASHSLLTETTVTDLADFGITLNPVANRATNTSTFMHGVQSLSMRFASHWIS